MQLLGLSLWLTVDASVITKLDFSKAILDVNGCPIGEVCLLRSLDPVDVQVLGNGVQLTLHLLDHALVLFVVWQDHLR